MHGSTAMVPGDSGLGTWHKAQGTWHSAVPTAAPSRGLSEAVLHPCILPITVSARVPPWSSCGVLTPAPGTGSVLIAAFRR